jgi:hypothetical protein
MSAYTGLEKTMLCEKEQWAKFNFDRKRSSYLEKDHRNTTAQVTAELDIFSEDPVSTKTVRREFHKSNIHDRAALA